MGTKPKSAKENILPEQIPPYVAQQSATDLALRSTISPDANGQEAVNSHDLQLLLNLVESANDVIYIHDMDGNITFSNSAAHRIFGYTREESLGLHIGDLLDPDQLKIAREATQSKVDGSEGKTYLISVKAKDGRDIPLELNTRLIYRQGIAIGVQGIGRDISKRIQAQAVAQQALAQNEQLFRTVIESSSDITAILTTDGTVKYQSPSVQTMLGFGPGELLGKNYLDLIHPDDRTFVAARIKDRFTRKQSLPPIEVRLKHKDGRWMPFESVSNPVFESGVTSGMLVNCRDISERKRQEADLHASEERFRQLFERNLAGVFVSTVEGKLLDCNASFAQIFGYSSREEILQIQTGELYYPDNDRQFFLTRLRESRALTNLESRMRRKDGMPVWVLENVSYIEAQAGALDTVQGTLLDITERKFTEQALIESESKFRAVAETASSAIYIHNNQRFLFANRSSEKISGYSAEELMHMNPFELVHPADHNLVRQRATERFFGSRQPDRYEYRIRNKQGGVRWLDFSASTVQFEGETAILGTAFDITQRKRVEQMQRALYRIADRSHAAEDLGTFFAEVHNIVGELMDAKNFFVALYDEDAQLISYPYYVDEHDSPPEGAHPPVHGLTEYVLRQNRPVLLRADMMEQLVADKEVDLIGSMFVDWIGAPLKSGNQIFGVIVAQSYSEDLRYSEIELEMLNFVSQHLASAILRKRHEEALRTSELRHRSLVYSAVYGIYRSSADGHFIEVNPAIITMLGYSSAEEVLGLNLAKDVYADQGHREQLIRQHPRKGRIENVEVKWKRKDGKPIIVRLSGRSIEKPDGSIDSFEMIAEDVTERRALEEQLRQSQKMEAVGRLAGGVAHDFNNLLTVIKGYSELMLDELKEADPFRAEVAEIKKAADRAAGLTRQLLAFSRQQVMAPKVLDLNSVVTNMDTLLKRLLGENIRFELVLGSGLGRVKADPGQLEQVIMNLAVNARDAMPRGGRLTVETANVELDETYVHDHVGAKPGSYVMLAVSDNGTGMTPQVRQRIFEPFYTTKELGKGTGLGLSTVYGIIKQSQGYIWVYSEPELGSSFKVYLPRVDAPADVRPLPAPARSAYQGTETVLLVEDEDGVRALVRQVLHKHGYTVLEARHGGEALLHCERYKADIHLLLSDVVLEQMSGTELAARLAGIRPKMKVLYISGYTDDAIVHHGVTQGTHFLQKPFTTQALARKIRQVLDESLGSIQ